MTTPISAQQRASLRAAVSEFQSPSTARAVWQIVSTFVPLLLVVAAMYVALAIGTWWSFALMPVLSIVAAGLLVRVFIIQHDCGHGSFFKSERLNAILGTLCGVFTFTPFANWRRQHAGHHGTWNNLDRRNGGVDIYSTCKTVGEYEAMGQKQRLWYRVVHHPIVYLLLLPPLVFLVVYRIAFDTPKSWRRERFAVYLNNALLLGGFVALGLLLGFGNVLLVQLSIISVMGVMGVFLFSVQHRFEQTLWARGDAWNAVDASLQGSSFLRLPRVLQWFTGNIGYHHIHHLNSRVPNYRLEACQAAIPALAHVPEMTLGMALGNWRQTLWDESANRMVSFREVDAGSEPRRAERSPGQSLGPEATLLQRVHQR